MNATNQAWNVALAGELRAERARHHGMTMDDLARQSRLSKVSVERYLNGKRPINVEVLAAMCEAFGVTVLEMIQRTEVAVARTGDGIARTGG